MPAYKAAGVHNEATTLLVLLTTEGMFIYNVNIFFTPLDI